MMRTLSDHLQFLKQSVDKELERLFPANVADDEPAARLAEAMRYAVTAGGKRLRPVLALTAAQAVGGRVNDVLPVAIALELIHTYSLVHDDLPCMDDDDLRRGRPTCHILFGEGMAVLTGDALLTRAFEVLADGRLLASAGAKSCALIMQEVACAAGAKGMVGGQVLDMEAEGRALPLDQLQRVHTLKTAALIRASVLAGALAGGASLAQAELLAQFGQHVGIAFQVIDDVLDVTANSEQLGKPNGSDARNQKATFVGLLGVERCQSYAEELLQAGLEALRSCPNIEARWLEELAVTLVHRTH